LAYRWGSTEEQVAELNSRDLRQLSFAYDLRLASSSVNGEGILTEQLLLLTVKVNGDVL
jgi:hypothetical protein